MSMLQRPPIDVNANVFCGSPQEAARTATTLLLDASSKLRPYAGAVIRNCIGPDTLNMLEGSDKEFLRTFKPPELNPINTVMQEWWGKQPQVEEYDVTDLAYSEKINYRVEPHYDQGVREDGTPEWGPISAFIGVRGVTNYYLSVLRHGPFGADRNEYWSMLQNKASGHMRAGKPTVTTKRGDLLLITNVPPTCHGTAFEGDRIGAVFFSRFQKKHAEVKVQ